MYWFFFSLFFFSFLIFFSLKWQLCHCIYRNKSLWPIYIQISLLKIFIYVIKKYTCAFYIEFCDNVLMSFLWILKCCISLWLLLFVVSWVCVSMGVCVHMCMMGVHVGKDMCVVSVTCILGICPGIISMCVGGYVWKLCMHLHTQICVCGRLYVCVCVPVYMRERISVWMEASNMGKTIRKLRGKFYGICVEFTGLETSVDTFSNASISCRDN